MTWRNCHHLFALVQYGKVMWKSSLVLSLFFFASLSHGSLFDGGGHAMVHGSLLTHRWFRLNDVLGMVMFWWSPGQGVSAAGGILWACIVSFSADGESWIILLSPPASKSLCKYYSSSGFLHRNLVRSFSGKQDVYSSGHDVVLNWMFFSIVWIVVSLLCLSICFISIFGMSWWFMFWRPTGIASCDGEKPHKLLFLIWWLIEEN